MFIHTGDKTEKIRKQTDELSDYKVIEILNRKSSNNIETGEMNAIEEKLLLPDFIK